MSSPQKKQPVTRGKKHPISGVLPSSPLVDPKFLRALVVLIANSLPWPSPVAACERQHITAACCALVVTDTGTVPTWDLCFGRFYEEQGLTQESSPVFYCWIPKKNIENWQFEISCQLLPSDPFGDFKWPFQGLSDLQLGYQKVTGKNLVIDFLVRGPLPNSFFFLPPKGPESTNFGIFQIEVEAGWSPLKWWWKARESPLNDWLVLSDEQMSQGWQSSLLNDEQMSNWLGVEHQPDDHNSGLGISS